MGKRVSALFASTTVAIGLTAGITPAHAAPGPAPAPWPDSGVAYSSVDFKGKFSFLPDALIRCAPLHYGHHSAKNTSSLLTIRLYNNINGTACFGPVAVLRPGQEDSGYIPDTIILSELGSDGAYYYSVSLF